MKKRKIAAIIQARITSTRLPGKVLMDIEGKPMLWHVINRLKFSEKLDNIILAIPDTKESDVLEKFVKENNIKYFRGSKEDVLSRYYETAKKFKIDVIVRITSDCPLIDPKIVDLVIQKHLDSETDYTSNTLERTFPRGLDVEVFNFKVLEKTQKEARKNYQREHVTPYIYEHPEIFELQHIEAKGKLRRPDLRLTVDTKEDLQLIKEIYRRLYKPKKIFYGEKIIDLLKKHQQLTLINKNIKQKIIEYKKMKQKNLNIQILTNKKSWIVPYAEKLVNLLRKRKNNVELVFSENKIKRGDILIILSWEKILSKKILNFHKNNLIVHGSALPKGRGWSPLTWQILEGKNKIPITLFEAVEELDAGPICLQDTMCFKGNELVDELRKRQGESTVELVMKFVEGYPNMVGRRQGGRITFYRRRRPKDSEIDINKSIKQLFNQFRVADNRKYPVFFRYKGHKYILKIYKEKKELV